MPSTVAKKVYRIPAIKASATVFRIAKGMNVIMTKRSTLAVLTAIGVVCALQMTRAQVLELPAKMRMSAVNMSNNLTGANGILEITIDKWSTPEERGKLLETVQAKGQQKLLSELQKAPVRLLLMFTADIRILAGNSRTCALAIWRALATIAAATATDTKSLLDIGINTPFTAPD